MDNFCYAKKPSHATTKSTLFTVSKGEWDTKEEDTGKSKKIALHVPQYAKRAPLRLKRCQTVKNQARSLSHYQVTLI